jgi:hypothetical protein
LCAMVAIACQAIDFKSKIFSGVKLSTIPYSQPAGASPRPMADFGSQRLSTASSLHTFCGKECAQARLCWLKYLIRFGLRSVLVFVAGPSLQAPRIGIGLTSSSVHTNCGKQCAQDQQHLTKRLILNRKHAHACFCSSGQLPSMSSPHILWITLCPSACPIP